MNSNMPDTGTEGGPWDVAKNYSQQFKNFPQNFASLVRRAHSLDEMIPNSFTWEVKRLLRSDGMKRSIYRLLTTLYDEDRVGDAIESPKQVLGLLEPKSFAVAICYLYIYKGLKKSIDEKEWELFLDNRACAFDLAPLIGLSLPATQAYHGLLGLAGRLIGLLVLMKAKPDQFKQYRRHLHKNSLFCDPEQEYKFFGCSHIEVASTLFVTMGIPGMEARHASESMMEEPTEMLYENAPDVYRYAIVMPWFNAFMANQDEPQMKHVGDYYPKKEDADNLRTQVHALLDDIGPYCWMDDATAEDE